MSITGLVLRFAAPLPRVEDYQRFLFLGPHPDDIEIGAGATAAKLCSQGKEVCFLICTDGRYGLGSAPKGTTPEELVSIRREEARRSAEMLGVRDLRFLDFSDGALYKTDELLRAVAGVIGDFQPDVVSDPGSGPLFHGKGQPLCKYQGLFGKATGRSISVPSFSIPDGQRRGEGHPALSSAAVGGLRPPLLQHCG